MGLVQRCADLFLRLRRAALDANNLTDVRGSRERRERIELADASPASLRGVYDLELPQESDLTGAASTSDIIN